MANAVGFVAVRERGLVAQWHTRNCHPAGHMHGFGRKSSFDNWDNRQCAKINAGRPCGSL
jgi:hypothetical protein